MEQVSSTKKNPAAGATATGSKNSNTYEGIFMSPRVAVRSNPAYTGRSNEFARLMAGARR
jgi:hypothetical protein